KNDGKVLLVSNGTIKEWPVLTFKVDNASERGLLGVAVSYQWSNNTTDDPGNESAYQFATYHWHTYVFLSLTEKTTDQGIRNRVYRYEWTGSVLVNPTLILDLPALPGPNHDGGKIKVGYDGSIYYVIGNLNRKGTLQNFVNASGPDDTSVIFRLNPDGSSPEDNPFRPR